MDPKRLLRELSPSAYRRAVRLRRGPAATKLTGATGRARTRRLFTEGSVVTVELGLRQGLGGILSNTAKVLHAAKLHHVDAALRFTSPMYAPSWGAHDWLECYFERLGSRPDDRPVCQFQHVPATRPPSPTESAALVWGALRIRDDIAAAAGAAAQGTFAAVHFRGSDKYIETPPVGAGVVLDVVESEMRRHGLGRLFVASDEARFIDLARARFGETAFWLPQEALATSDGTPPHFTDVPGEIKAREALTTMLILARAKLLVKTESHLSEWAATLANDQRVVRMTPLER
jgi:hypothetical protein